MSIYLGSFWRDIHFAVVWDGSLPISMPAVSDEHLVWLIDSGTRCEEDMAAGVPDLDGRLPLYFYSTISRPDASSTWPDKYLLYRRLSGALDWLQLSKMHVSSVPTQPSESTCWDPNPGIVCRVSDLLPLHCLHNPNIPSSVRAMLRPNSPSNLEAASTSMDISYKSWHVIYGLFYRISSLIFPLESLLPINY